MSGGTHRLARPSILLVAIFVAFLGLAAGPVAHPAPVSASTADNMEGLIVTWVNAARANRGVPALRVGSKLTSLAGDRAAHLAGTQQLVLAERAVIVEVEDAGHRVILARPLG